MLNIRNLPISEPITLYADLEKAIEYGENITTAKVKESYEHRLGEGYLLGGLEVSNLNDAGLGEETLARLGNALDTENISYALFPNDQRKGQLPLILDTKTRSYIETHLRELMTNSQEDGKPIIKWFLYVLPMNIDPDNNERSGSIKLTDDNDQIIETTYDQITNYFNAYGFVEENDDDDIFIEEEEESTTEEMPEELTDEEKRMSKSMVLPDQNENSSYYDDIFFEEDESEEEDSEEDENIPNEDEKDEILKNTNSEDNEEDIEEFEGTKEDLLNFEEEQSNSMDNNINEENESDLTKELTTEQEQPQTNEELASLNEKVESYMNIPEELANTLKSLEIPKFNDFPKDGIHETTRNTIQKEIDDANTHIKGIEEEIKRDAISVYQKYMTDAFESIKKELNIETGNDIVINYYNKVRDKQSEFDRLLDEEVENRRQELREHFYGDKLEDYKQELLANARKWHEDEHFEEDVEQPLNEYREERLAHYNEKKSGEREEFDYWLESMEEVSAGKDQADAIIRTKEYITNAINASQTNVNQLQQRMDEIYHELTLIEYQQRSEENIRKSVGQSLHTDEQAKIYQKEVEQLLTEKASTETEHKKYITEMKEKEKLEKEQHQKDIQEIEDNHKKILEDYKDQIDAINKEKQEISQSYNDEKLINNNDKKKSIFKFGIPSFLAAALLFGGGGAIISNVGDSEQEQEMKKQSNKIEEQEKSIKSKEKELEEQQKAQEKQEDELNKAKKEAEEAKKDKKDKDKKKD
ncbi:hypothetical protein ACN0TX_12285 [Staphylococcus cohnii]|uniref:hypothetical protein n=1 Tax=Staphylococcus cohnii TaxID=29382 RepID=UPI003AF9023C